MLKPNKPTDVNWESLKTKKLVSGRIQYPLHRWVKQKKLSYSMIIEWAIKELMEHDKK